MNVFMKGQRSLRKVQWGAQYLWDIRFPNAPPPFNEWFPAVDVEENLFSLNTKEYELGHASFSHPISHDSFDIKVTFNDDVKLAIHNWLTKWVRTRIFNNGLGISPLDQCVEVVQIVKTDFRYRVLATASYWVFPRGVMYFSGTSSASPAQNQIEFVIAGAADNRYTAGGGSGKSLFSSGLGNLARSFGMPNLGQTLDTVSNAVNEARDVYDQVRSDYETIKTTISDVKEVVKSVRDIRNVTDAFNAFDDINNLGHKLKDGYKAADSAVSSVVNLGNKITKL